MRPSPLSTLAALFLAAAPVAAQPGDPAIPLSRLMEEMAKKPAATARFVEKRHMRILTQPMVIEGTLTYSGGRLEKHTIFPKEERIVIEGGRMVIHRPGQSGSTSVLLSDFPALEAFIIGLRSTLAGDLQRLKRDFWVKYNASGRNWQIVLTPLAETASGEVQEVRIMGKGFKIASLEVIEIDGDRSVIRIYSD